jgi:predicted adenylyl cyclase CyaB
MARNVEIKARARDLARQARLAESLGYASVERLVQEDTFFTVPVGRLKLRVFEDGAGELIYYERDDSSGPAESRYVRSRTDDPGTLREALTNALGVRAIVRKKRTVYLVGQTRIHFDQVEGLGAFIELEVVLEPSEPLTHGVAIAEDLMSKLEIGDRDLVEAAYVDLLCESAAQSGNDQCSAEPSRP